MLILCKDDRLARSDSVGHRQFGPRQLPAGNACRNAGGVEHARSFGHGKGADQLATCNQGKQCLLLLLATRQQQRFGEKIDARRERHRGHCPPEFLGQRAKFDISQPESTVGLGDGGPAPALLADPRPQRGIVALTGILQHCPRDRKRRGRSEEPPRFVLQRLLVFGIVEVHAPSPLVPTALQ